MSKAKGLSNPAALVATSAIVPVASKAADKGIDFLDRNAKPILLTAGVIALLYFGPKAYKSARAKAYANKNIGDPNLTAAAIIYSSIKRIEPTGLLSWILPEINYWTNEGALNTIASDPNVNIQKIASAYRIMYDRVLFTDVQGGLSTNELTVWYARLSSKNGNASTLLYPIGSTLYAAQSNVTVNIAEYVAGEWKGTGRLYGKIDFNEKVGEVIAHGIYNGDNYYIVEKCNFLGMGCSTGVVLQHQVTDIKK